MRLAISQTPLEDYQLTPVWKNSQRSNDDDDDDNNNIN